MQRHLRDKAKEKKEKGNNVKLSYGKIFVVDKWYWWNKKQTKLTEDKRRGRE